MKVVFAGALLRFVDHQKEIEIAGQTLGECCQNLMDRFPKLKAALLDNKGNILQTHRFLVNMAYIDPKFYHAENQNQLRLNPGDSLHILTAFAGG